MFDSDHDTDADLDTPTAADMLAEAGLDPKAVCEVLTGCDGAGE